MFVRRKQIAEQENVTQLTGARPPADEGDECGNLEIARAMVRPAIEERIGADVAKRMPRRDLAGDIKAVVAEFQNDGSIKLNRLETRDLITTLINYLLQDASADGAPPPVDAASTLAPKVGDGAGADATSFTPGDEPLDPAKLAELAESTDSAVSVTPALPGGRRATDTESEIRALEVFSDPGQDADDVGATAASLAASLPPELAVPVADADSAADGSGREFSLIEQTKQQVQPILMERIDVASALQMPRVELARQIAEIVAEILFEQRVRLNLVEQRDLVTMLINDMLGLGPLEPLLADDSVTDILVNGPNQVYVERAGKLQLSDVRFRDDTHVLNVATRIVTQIGRRIDETTPLVDARLMDGSRVNIIIPPLAIDGPSISIRKFSKKSITLDIMSAQKNISPNMATVMKIAARCRLNILISGGTGSGKTTLLNAMSQLIDHGERIVTIEDAAELQLQQPHVVRLETRTPNLEGKGEITMRDLVKNSLRMRPDRIILGEIRGEEAIDMLQAMNTGHEGSMSTVHANRPREALTRLENMVGMAGINLPAKSVRTQIVAAIDMIIQISRMRDGVRRITAITEVTGMEGDVIVTQDLFNFAFEGIETDGSLTGTFKSAGLRPHFIPKAEYFGLERTLMEAI